MEDPHVSSSSTTIDPYEFIVKQEKPDSDRRSDKVLQFALALQRSSERAPNVIHEKQRPGRGPIRIDYVDLTLSSDDEDATEEEPSRSTSSTTLPLALNTNEVSDSGRRVNEMATIESTQVQPPELQTTVMEEGEVDMESALEVNLEETDEPFERQEIYAAFKNRKFPKTHGQGLTLPYTDEQKRIALAGNVEYDYRTKLGPNGEETYAIYKCNKCPTGFPRMHHYLIHVKGHGNNPFLKYPCDVCDYRTTNSIFLANHMDRHRLQKEPHIFANLHRGPRGNQTVGNGQKRSAQLASTQKAKRRHADFSLHQANGENTEMNGLPAALAPSQSIALDLSTQETCPGAEEPCRSEARKGNPSLVYRISKRYHPNGHIYERSTYKCQQCPYNHEKYDEYLKHLEGHKQQRLYQCHLCTYSANTQVNLGRHLSCVHGQPQTVEKNHVRRNGQKLENRRQTFPNGVSQVTNEEVVGELRRSSLSSVPLQCPKCPSKFNGTGNLGIHQKQHGNFKLRLRCPHCDYCSSRDDYMKNHIQLHLVQNRESDLIVSTVNSDISDNLLGVEPSPSTIAIKPRKGPNPGNLTEEAIEKMIKGNPLFTYMQKSANGYPLPLESSFKCWHCPYATLQYSSYLGHLERHDGNKAQFSCNKCSYSAKSLQGLKNHNLAHTIQHATTKEKSIVQQDTPNTTEGHKLENGTPFPCTPPMIYPNEMEIHRDESGQFFITNIKIQNVMPMNEEPTVADVSTHGILKLKGKSEEGKSSYILAVMLGLGYDLCLDYKDSTTSICGLNLKNVISHGKDFASIELTLSLRSFPELQKEFGSQLKFSRRINRTQSKLSNVLVASSADPRPQFKSIRPKVLGGKDLKEFLLKLKLTPERMRLMLLDGENVKYLMDNTDLWFGFLEAAVDESAVEIDVKIKESNFLLQRLQGEQKLQQELLEVFKSRLHERPPLDSEKIRQVKEEDWMNHSKCTLEINQLAKEKRELQKKLGDFVVQTNDGTEGYLLRMRTIFNKFLYELNYAGEIMVSYQTKELSICIWKIDSPDVPPGTMDEVKEVWKSMSTGRRRIAVIGLYLALWEISNYLGILAADAYSCTEADFQVPPSGLPILWELLNRKCLEQKQCIISLPPDY